MWHPLCLILLVSKGLNRVTGGSILIRLDTLQDLLVDQLQHLYCAQQQILELLPKMARCASSPDLIKTLKEHHITTEKQFKLLDEIFHRLSISHDHQGCEGIEGLIKESRKIIELQGDPAVKDAALIAEAQKVEHYEISGYGSVRTFARELGYSDIADLLQEILDRENEVQMQLTSLEKGGFFSTGLNSTSP